MDSRGPLDWIDDELQALEAQLELVVKALEESPGVDRDLFEDDTEALTLRDANLQIVDTLVYEGRRGVWDHALVEGEWETHHRFDAHNRQILDEARSIADMLPGGL